MWETISSSDEISRFMEKVYYFHDSCVKEMSYISGAYVNDSLAMHPLNDRRILRVVIQWQFDENSMIEMEFQGLKYLKLFPVDPYYYTCEILGSAMLLKDGDIYWCDCGDVTEDDLDDYKGTLICASKLRWRAIENHMGEKTFYHSDVEDQSEPTRETRNLRRS